MSRKLSYKAIAEDFRLWIEAVDPDATMTEEEFNALSTDKKIQIQVDCFGPEEIPNYIVPAIAVPHQFSAVIWWERPIDDPESDGHDLHAILESRTQAEKYVADRRHQYDAVAALINQAWPR